METVTHTIAHGPNQNRALKIIAKSVYRELKAAGYGREGIVRFTNELLEQVTDEFRQRNAGQG
jgi:hypothetical protein